MKITWNDQSVSELPAKRLRQECRCAACIHETTGQQLLDKKSVSDDIKIEKADVVGNYALSFSFSDGHGSGFYTFEHLKEIG